MKAFPHIAKVHMLDGNSIIKEEITSGGMDLRDWFAGKALQGILSCNYSVDEEPAVLAYQYADEMMKARETKC
jgi:hypothetical protein